MAVTGYVWPDEEEVTIVASRCRLQSCHHGADGKLLCMRDADLDSFLPTVGTFCFM
jgi:hypothetical protein